MSVALEDLTESLRTSLNTPGDTTVLFNFDDTDDWVLALANGFWKIRRRTHVYDNYRVNRDTFEVFNTTTGGADLEAEDTHLIVIQTALDAIRTKMLTLFTLARDKSGPSETERQRSSSLLKDLHDGLTAELESMRDEIVNGDGTRTHVIDAILTRSGIPHPFGVTAPFIR